MNENHHRRHSHDHSHNGFVDKLFKDCKKIYNYKTHKHEIKFKNERPEKSAYIPTEVMKNLIITLMTLNFSDNQLMFFSSLSL